MELILKTEKFGYKNFIVLFLFFLSGLTALVYEVLWLKELGLLFGNTAYAAATTLVVFFLGISFGGYFWGKYASRLKNPLRWYGILEIAIAFSALLYFLLLDLYFLIYPFLFSTTGEKFLPFIIVKFILSLGLLFLPAFFMGGTFPVLGQYLILGANQLGKRGSLLYACNTGGAALGVFLAGFYLPPILGFNRSYLLAIAINILIGIVSYLISIGEERRIVTVESNSADNETRKELDLTINPRLIWSLAFLSGFVAMSLEVLWTRMFAQVVHNSVYSFSAILIIFLIALTLGAIVANLLSRLKMNPLIILNALLILSGLMVGISSLVFYRLTDGLVNIYSNKGWAAYTLSIFTHAAIVILIPGIFLGSVYPFLLKVSQWIFQGSGKTIGRLAAINAFGGIMGAVGAGFFFLNFLGLWTSIKLMAILYFIAAIFIVDRLHLKRLALRSVPAIGLVLLISFLYSSNLPLVKLNPKMRENLVEVWEGSHGVVAVVKQGQDLKIKVDNYYALGGVSASHQEQNQAHIPLFIHPDPGSVFFLGMGTGITAGASLSFPVQKVITCELIPEVVIAADKYYRHFNNRIFDDPRSKIVIEDGRNFLMGSREKFDVIISDLFIPWHAGTGTLYSREHFALTKYRLKEGGLFVQWMPLFQVSKKEFMIVVRTMLEVFPQVTLWRGDFISDWPTVALIGQSEGTPLNTENIRRNVKHIIKNRPSDRITDVDVVPYVLYSGNLTEVKHLFENYPMNSDNYPLIEFLSPRTQQEQESKRVSSFASIQLVDFFDQLFSLTPPEADPYLENLTDEQIGYVYAGLYLHEVRVYKEAGRLKEARAIYKKFLSLIPMDIYPELKE
jgi:spermidine synthase